MSYRKLLWILVVADAICFAVAIVGHLIWQPVASGPQTMQVWQLLAWIFAASLLLLIILAAGSAWRAARNDRR